MSTRQVGGSRGEVDGGEGRQGTGARARPAGEVYRPEALRCLLVAAALPDRLDRFFYDADARRADYLFLGVMQVLYPGLKDEFLASRRSRVLKERLLRRFQADGFFLLDLPEVAQGRSFGVSPRAVAQLVERVGQIANHQTPILLIKAATFEAAWEPLQAAGYQRVHRRAIPFPSQGWQHRFHELFGQALVQAGVGWRPG